MAVGHNNFDLPAMTKAGVLATNTPDVLTETTADFAWALLMTAARRVSESERWLREGHWKKWTYDTFLGTDVFGATLGIIGMGRIGRAIAKRATGFSMHVQYHNRTRVDRALEDEYGVTYVSKDTLLQSSDYVVLVLPYSAASHHAIGKRELSLMKPSAILVNLARGGVVDDQALAEALKENRIGSAALDVFEKEPQVNTNLLDVPHAVLTPHIGSATIKTRRAMAELAADNLLSGLGLAGNRERYVLNPEVTPRARNGLPPS
jgi:lactate dehydrogenase-like 2-hydroxyacid dehydrogenase